MLAPIIAGNWKLNHGPAETEEYFRRFLPLLPARHSCSVAIFPPAVSLLAATSALAGRQDVTLGVQNVYWEDRGAFTGEISASLAREAGAGVVLVGHSERRHVFGETNSDTARKMRAVLDAGLAAMLCVGETLPERESGRAFDIVSRQLDDAVGEVADGELSSVIIAYEPVWAIGTGRTASPDDASEMHAHIRSRLVGAFGTHGGRLPVLYGGSVRPDNAEDLLNASDVDGLLIGGASLDPTSFAAICGACS